MKTKTAIFTILIVMLLIPVPTRALSEEPAIEWQKTLGGTNHDRADRTIQTQDGDFVVIGITHSNDGDVSGNHGSGDVWIAKLNDSGSIKWQKTFGGSGGDDANRIIETEDGGYVFAGNTTSNDKDVSGYHGGGDIWVVKLDTDGEMEWQRPLGGSNYDEARSIHQTKDGGYVVLGETTSSNGDASGYHGDPSVQQNAKYGIPDIWVVKLDAGGRIKWQRTLGGSDIDGASSIHPVEDGGYLVFGHTFSNDGDVSGNDGAVNPWIVKLDAEGKMQWQKTLGGSDEGYLGNARQTEDGGYVLEGVIEIGNSEDDSAMSYAWIVKLDAEGEIMWQKTLGRGEYDAPGSIIQTEDGGYAVFGGTLRKTLDGDVSKNLNEFVYETWIAKLDAKGESLWQKTIDATRDKYTYSVHQTEDGGYILTGNIYLNDGRGIGNYFDYLVVKLDAEGEIMWQKTLGGSGFEGGGPHVFQAEDSGYLLFGSTDSNDGDIFGNHGVTDWWIVKLSASEVAARSAVDVVFTIGSQTYTVGDTPKGMDVAPYIKNGRTMLPIRFVAEATGVSEGNIIWNGVAKTVVVTKGERIVRIRIGSPMLEVNGAVTPMDAVAGIIDGRTMLPLRSVAQALGLKVEWNETTREVTVR